MLIDIAAVVVLALVVGAVALVLRRRAAQPTSPPSWAPVVERATAPTTSRWISRDMFRDDATGYRVTQAVPSLPPATALVADSLPPAEPDLYTPPAEPDLYAPPADAAEHDLPVEVPEDVPDVQPVAATTAQVVDEPVLPEPEREDADSPEEPVVGRHVRGRTADGRITLPTLAEQIDAPAWEFTAPAGEAPDLVGAMGDQAQVKTDEQGRIVLPTSMDVDAWYEDGAPD